VVVLDDLSTGNAEAVLHGELVIGKTGDTELLQRLFSEHKIETIMHFAAHTIVPESVTDPLKYYGNNTSSTRNLSTLFFHPPRQPMARQPAVSPVTRNYPQPQSILTACRSSCPKLC